MDHFQRIYSSQAEAYHKMIVREDTAGNLQAALESLTSFKGKRILDLGTGTGRLPLLFWVQSHQLVGIDLYMHMLQYNLHQREMIQAKWDLIMGDMLQIPISSGWADIITAGWSLGHLRGWFPHNWKKQMDKILNEIHRLVKPDGWIFIIETLSTGCTTPIPPTVELAGYYAWLEQIWDFKQVQIPTDYQFSSTEEAISCTEFFFGVELSHKIRQEGWSSLPEWTGIWSKQKSTNQ